MSYLKINGIDFSNYVNELNVDNESNYNAQINAAGDTVVDYINTKTVLSVGIIPIEDEAMRTLLAVLNNFNVSVEYRDPASGILKEINCIIPKNGIEYYTIRQDKVMYNAFEIEFIEL